MKSIAGKVAIITGASAGIGLGIAKYFSREGAIVAMCSRNPETIEQAAQEVRAQGGRVLYKACDVTSVEQINAFVEYVVEQTGGVDILVNNAAYLMSTLNPLNEWDEAKYLKAIDAGVNSVYRFMNRIFPLMKDNGGKIINMTSIGGIRGVQGTGGYAAAKSALIGLTRVAANDWGKYRINVNCVAPMAMSATWAERMKEFPEGTDPWEVSNVRSNALGYVGDAEKDIAPVVAFLASENANYITGAIIPADGGLLDVE